MQSSPNLTDDLISRGVTREGLPVINKVWDVNGSVGGPIVKDKLWFFNPNAPGAVKAPWSTATSRRPRARRFS